MKDLTKLAGICLGFFQVFFRPRRGWLLTVSTFSCHSVFSNMRKHCGKGVIVNYLVCLFSIIYRNGNVSVTKVTQFSYGASDARTNR